MHLNSKLVNTPIARMLFQTCWRFFSDLWIEISFSLLLYSLLKPL